MREFQEASIRGVSLISFAQRTGYRLISLRDEEIARLVVTGSVF